MSKRDLEPGEQLMLSAIRLYPNLQQTDKTNQLILNVKDWKIFQEQIMQRGMGPLFYKKLDSLSNKDHIPPQIRESLKQNYFRTLSRSMLLYAHFKEIASRFEKEGLAFIPLKGVFLSDTLYKDIALRQFSDMDLLVHPEDGPKALLVLNDIGFRAAVDLQSELIKSFVEVIHYMPMIRKDVSVEIHIKLHTRKAEYFVDPEKIWAKSVPEMFQGQKINRMHPYDMLIHLCVHLDKHFLYSTLQFTCYNDVVNWTEHIQSELNWNDFIDRCKEFKAEEAVFRHLIIAREYYDLKLPENIYSKYKYLLDKKCRKLFVYHLRGKKVLTSAVDTHLGNMNQIDNLSKIKYFFDVVFPKAGFMIGTYKIRHRWMVPFYYPYRHWIGLRGLIKSILNRK